MATQLQAWIVNALNYPVRDLAVFATEQYLEKYRQEVLDYFTLEENNKRVYSSRLTLKGGISLAFATPTPKNVRGMYLNGYAIGPSIEYETERYLLAPALRDHGGNPWYRADLRDYTEYVCDMNYELDNAREPERSN